MGGSIRPVTVVMLSLCVAVLLANSRPAQASGKCQEKLVGKSYNCNFKYSDGTEGPVCFEFVTADVSALFDLDIGGAEYGCSCDATGSYKSPTFDDSSTFECVSSNSWQINGKTKSKKLSGQGSNRGGVSAIYTCTLSSSPCPPSSD